MKAYTFDQLMYANEVCFPDRMKQLMAKHSPVDYLVVYYSKWLVINKCNLIEFIFSFSRQDLTNVICAASTVTLSEFLEKIVDDLIRNKT